MTTKERELLKWLDEALHALAQVLGAYERDHQYDHAEQHLDREDVYDTSDDEVFAQCDRLIENLKRQQR